jgi:hypothetical protein
VASVVPAVMASVMSAVVPATMTIMASI